MGIIYEAKNIINNMLYVGKTIKTLRLRATQHCNDAKNSRDNSYLHKAIRKYGNSNFVWRVLIEVDDSLLDSWERYYIDLALDQGFELYNLTDGGEGSSGYKPSYETRQKMSESHKGHAHITLQKTYVMRSPSGEIVSITNMRKFCRENGLNQGNMFQVANGYKRSCQGWTKLEE